MKVRFQRTLEFSCELLLFSLSHFIVRVLRAVVGNRKAKMRKIEWHILRCWLAVRRTHDGYDPGMPKRLERPAILDQYVRIG